MFEEVEKIIDTLKTKKNLHYIQFVPHREQHSVLWWETLFGVGGIGKCLSPILRNAYEKQSIGNPGSRVFGTDFVEI